FISRSGLVAGDPTASAEPWIALAGMIGWGTAARSLIDSGIPYNPRGTRAKKRVARCSFGALLFLARAFTWSLGIGLFVGIVFFVLFLGPNVIRAVGRLV